MNDAAFYRLAGAAAMFGGGLRIATAFVPWDSSSAVLELLALKIDLLCLFGLVGIYLANRARAGFVGLLAFVVAASGIASIVGPDTMAFGIDTYQIGVAVIVFGLAIFGLTVIRGALPLRIAGLCWILSLAIGHVGALAGYSSEAFLIGGILYGAGFVAGGLSLV